MMCFAVCREVVERMLMLVRGMESVDAVRGWKVVGIDGLLHRHI